NVARSASPGSTWYQMPLIPRTSSQLATRVVLPAPGGPTTHMAGLLARASSSKANRRSRATALCKRGLVSLASCGCLVGISPSPMQVLFAGQRSGEPASGDRTTAPAPAHSSCTAASTVNARACQDSQTAQAADHAGGCFISPHCGATRSDFLLQEVAWCTIAMC